MRRVAHTFRNRPPLYPPLIQFLTEACRPLSYRLLAVLFGLGVALHNLEEALFLPDWMRAHVRAGFRPNKKIYWVLAALVTAFLWVVISGSILSPLSPRLHWAVCGFALAMSVNAVVPHLMASLATRSYNPGTATGILLNLPLGWLLVRRESAGRSFGEFLSHALPYALALAVGALGTLWVAHWVVGRSQAR